MKRYKITQEIELDLCIDHIRVCDKHFDITKVKEYLLTYHEALCNKYKLNSRTHYDSKGQLHVYYAWDSIFVKAHEKRIFWSIWNNQNRNTENCTPTPI